MGRRDVIATDVPDSRMHGSSRADVPSMSLPSVRVTGRRHVNTAASNSLGPAGLVSRYLRSHYFCALKAIIVVVVVTFCGGTELSKTSA